MADDPRAALRSLEQQLRELAGELSSPPPAEVPPPARAAPPPVPPQPPSPPAGDVTDLAARVAEAAEALRAAHVAPASAAADRAPRPVAAPLQEAVVPPQPETPPVPGTTTTAVPADVDALLHVARADDADRLLALRDAVAALPEVEDAYLRTAVEGAAVIEVRLR